MENKHVGLIIIGIAIVLVFIIFLFQSTLKEIVLASCGLPHAVNCPMNQTIKQQTYLSLGIVGILMVIGFVLVFTKPKEKIVLRKIKEKVEVQRKPVDYSKLNNEEKAIAKILENNSNGMFQSDLVEKSGFGKVKITRILDKLEARQIIERKRRGMNNFVVLR